MRRIPPENAVAHTGRRPQSLRRCKRLVRDLHLPARRTLTLDATIEHLSQRRGRPIHLLPHELPPQFNGLWISSDTDDYIVFEQRLTPVHQHQVILHELGHIVCDHNSPVINAKSSWPFLPSLNPAFVQRVLGREHADTLAEQEAEFVGSLLGRRTVSWTLNPSFTVPSETQDIAARLSTLLEQ
ncbi:hypothetical protein FB471_1367 [Amycolatopsis cihanbeyliensis]|uniref:IrrE N-terminal-like domain-containing protein n=2 Tax=Amycolatopsis cihanbeyliensis TaxID=1128664 RepID=A0A542DF23_AMYCI|nr:hypothetical protein FB471_1367 [Amycolatopsis cihanbeyliensis]